MKSIKKSKLKDELRDSIQHAILSGELKPGDRIVETRIAADMGVSQAPVREALKELEHIGLVETRSYQGTYVKQLTQRDLSDAYEARLILELYAVEVAAKIITPEQLSLLRELMAKMDGAAFHGDIRAFVDYDVEFHASIINSGGNGMVEKLWNLANISLWTYVTANLSNRSLDNLSARHIDVYKTLESHDAPGAREAMRAHLLELRNEMVAGMTTVTE